MNRGIKARRPGARGGAWGESFSSCLPPQRLCPQETKKTKGGIKIKNCIQKQTTAELTSSLCVAPGCPDAHAHRWEMVPENTQSSIRFLHTKVNGCAKTNPISGQTHATAGAGSRLSSKSTLLKRRRLRSSAARCKSAFIPFPRDFL